MKIIGILIMVFGVADFADSYAGYDLWGEYIQVQLPDLLWQYSAYVEIVLGYIIMNLGSSSEEEIAD